MTDPREDGAVHAATRATFTPVPSAGQARERRPRRVHLLRTSAFRSVCLRADTPAWSLGGRVRGAGGEEPIPKTGCGTQNPGPRTVHSRRWQASEEVEDEAWPGGGIKARVRFQVRLTLKNELYPVYIGRKVREGWLVMVPTQ